MKQWLIPVTVFAGIAAVGVAYIYAGIYDIAADKPHWPITTKILETLRQRSIEIRAADIEVPELETPRLVLQGAGEYAAMCRGCHLAPGAEESAIRLGLYPKPPDLSEVRIDPKLAFWVIKHGIKMTGMPAWGRSHDDDTLWAIVAFIRKLPEMTPQEYQDITAKAQAGEETTHMGTPGNAQDGHTH
ncbi:Cytochrome C oxidase, cbb3-type, subunit III [Nitrosospira sp. Nl5]|uniref:c-type cytochrome n=1 Tax=Nitrosospira sp. Nl5 TaxID=200120 RepID=UPI0008822517|nr:cytochrome c [Nitrosospira sp. Nl5]SCY09683.1 Cytochrome C oxidase, cbb3-type, subunit III [Nitrosospira sp. Nl5]